MIGVHDVDGVCGQKLGQLYDFEVVAVFVQALSVVVKLP